MALSKDIDIGIGVSAKYWRVDELALNKPNGSIAVVVRGYLTKTAAQSGAKPVGEARTYGLASADFLGSVDALAVAYQKIKTSDEWSGAANV